MKVDTDTVPWLLKIQALLVGLGHSFRGAESDEILLCFCSGIY